MNSSWPECNIVLSLTCVVNNWLCHLHFSSLDGDRTSELGESPLHEEKFANWNNIPLGNHHGLFNKVFSSS